MSTLALWCHRHRRSVLLGWFALLVGLALLVGANGTSFADVAELPNSESTKAYELMASAGLNTSDDTEQGNIVWHVADGSVTDPAVESTVALMLAAVDDVPGVQAVANPYAEDASPRIDTESATAFATVTVTGSVDVEAVRAAIEPYSTGNLDIAAGGQGLSEMPSPSHGQEVIGILAALAILFLVFRSPWAAALPIVTGVMGVGTSLLAVMLGSHAVDLSDTSLTMGALIGLGVGIDYALFIVNRFRKALVDGQPVPTAIALAVDTSGRAVVFAGLTVIAALVGIFVVGMPVLTGMGIAAAITVLFTVASAITLLPALLSMIGTRALSRRQRRALAAGPTDEPLGHPSPAARWAALTQRFPVRMGLLGLIVLVVLAGPVTQLRIGSSDASSDPVGSPTREYYDLMTPAFGSGVDATLVLAASTPDDASRAAINRLVAVLPEVEDVAAVSTVPTGDGTVAMATVTPASSAQSEQTADLVATLRDQVVPDAVTGTQAEVYVGGETATSIDLSNALMDRLPLYLGLIALLGFGLLAVAFRSILVPLVGAVSNLATILASLGAITAIFQLGWGSELLGVGTGAPIMYIVPVLVVGVMFGLSMDYQVFLVSRMHEEWTHTRDNRRAVRVGVSETATVIVTAATIMTCVFASFSFTGERIVATMGIGLAVGVLADAFLVRLTVIPAVMRLIGQRNWAYPRWADRITPHLSVEGTPPAAGTGASDTEVAATVGAAARHLAANDAPPAPGTRFEV